jgi:hypothetical protein
MHTNEGIVQKAMKIEHHRSLPDTAGCQTFTEVIVTGKAQPYVLGTRLRVATGSTPLPRTWLMFRWQSGITAPARWGFPAG